MHWRRCRNKPFAGMGLCLGRRAGAAGGMIEFEVMIGPIKALRALIEG
jgi:hypothetical protein